MGGARGARHSGWSNRFHGFTSADGEANPELASSSAPMEFSIAECSVAGSKRSWASSSWQALRSGSSAIGSLLAHTQVPGLEADVSAVDQLADFLIEEQDVFLSHGETTAENLRSWVDRFSAVGLVTVKVSVNPQLIDERLKSTRELREAVSGCMRSHNCIRMSNVVDKACKQLAKQFGEHINEFEALRGCAGSKAVLSVMSRDGPNKRARLVDKFELLSEAEQRHFLRGSQLSRADTVVSLSGPASEIGSLDQAMGEASISSVPVSADLGRPMDSRPDEAKVRPAPTTVDISPSDSRPLGDESGTLRPRPAARQGRAGALGRPTARGPAGPTWLG